MLVTNLSMKLSFFLPIEKRKFVEISHVVSCDDFVIFVSYDLRGEIQQFICDIIGEAKKMICTGMVGRSIVGLLKRQKMKIVIVLLIVLILFLQYKKNVCIKHLDG